MEVNKITVAAVLLFVLCTWGAQMGSGSNVVDTRRETGFRWIMNRLTANPNMVENFIQGLESGLGRKIDIEPQLDNVRNVTSCFPCKVSISFTKNLITYDQ